MAEQTKTYTQMRNEFYKRFTTNILPVLRKYENERKKKYIKAVFLTVLYSTLTFIQIILPFILVKIDSEIATASSSGSDVLLKGALLTFGLAITTYPFMKKSFENKIKEIIMPTVVSGFGNLNWEVGGYSDGVIYEFVQVVPQHDTWSYDDIFRGEHKGIKFEISESKFYKELFPDYTDRRGERQNGIMRKVFQGVVIKIEMNKNFSGHTLIKPNTLLHNPPMEYLSRTILESSEFENKYDVFTTDEVEARYLITPTFMNRLNNIEVAFKAKDLCCGFYYNNLFISLKTKCDLFSIAQLHRPIDDSKQYFQMYEEIISIIKLIDHFKLDQKTGL